MQPQQVEHNVIDATATDDNTTTETKDKVVRNMDLEGLMKAFPQFKGRVFTFFARADVYKFSRFVVTKRSARTFAAKRQGNHTFYCFCLHLCVHFILIIASFNGAVRM